MLVRNSRWTERLDLLSRLTEPAPNGWNGLPALLSELGKAFDYARLDFIWPLERVEVSASSKPTGEAISVPPELIARIQGKSDGVSLDPQRTERRYGPVRIPKQPVGLLIADGAEPWDAEAEAALNHLAGAMARSPWLTRQLGITDRALIDRLNDGATLAGRLAHDYDNLWTGILGFAELTIPAMKPGSNEQQYIQEVATIGQRGISMTAQLHQFSRSGAVKPIPASVASVISREQARLKQTFNGRIRWSVELPATLPSVCVESGSLGTVLGHLLDNAVESMPNGGPLKVIAEKVGITATEAGTFLGDVRPGPYVVVKMTDAGTGIKDDVKAKLFRQPFFTTKTRHRGLGLAIVYRTLFVHRGGLTIESDGEKGTTVRVALPVNPVPPQVSPASALDRPTTSTSNTTLTGGR